MLNQYKKTDLCFGPLSCDDRPKIIYSIYYFMPPPRSGEGHIVLPFSVRTYIRTSVTLFSTVLVSATPPKVFDAET